MPRRIAALPLRQLGVAGDFEPETRHARHLARRGHQPHAPDTEIAQDLRADAVEAQVHSAAAVRRARFGKPRLQRLARLRAVEEHHHSRARLPDGGERFADAPRMGARTGIEQVDHRQRLVHAHQNLSLRRRTALHEREVNRTEREIPIGHQMKTSPGRLDVALQDTLHQRFIAAAVLDQIGDGADLELVLGGEESLVQRVLERDIETAWGSFHLVSYRDLALGSIHLALVQGRPSPQTEVLVRVHEPLSVVDLLDAGPGTHSWGVGEALATIRQAGTGVMVLLNCTQTSEALEARLAEARTPRGGRGMDLRLYGIGAQILRDLGVGRMRLMAAPRKMPSMAGFGLEVTGYAELPKR